MQIAFHELLIEEYLIEISVRIRNNVEITKKDDVLVTSEMSKQLDLSQRPFAEDLLPEYVRHFLYGNLVLSLLCLGTFGRTHHSVGALAQSSDKFKPFIDNEFLVEHVENVVHVGVEILDRARHGAFSSFDGLFRLASLDELFSLQETF